MNIITELLRYIIIIIIGIILIRWYERKKGWNPRFRTSLLFILGWRTLIFIFVLIITFYLDLAFLNEFSLYFIYSIILVILSFFISIFLGVKIFNLVFRQKMQESIVIILIITIIEMILESIILYSILIPEAIIANFNL